MWLESINDKQQQIIPFVYITIVTFHILDNRATVDNIISSWFKCHSSFCYKHSKGKSQLVCFFLSQVVLLMTEEMFASIPY